MKEINMDGKGMGEPVYTDEELVDIASRVVEEHILALKELA